MNIRTVLRTYGLLRQLSDDETALLETLRSLTDSDREQLVESLAPVKTAVRKRKPRTRSPRAESLATAIGGTAGKTARCDREDCSAWASNPIHDPAAGYGGYHEFVAPKAVRAAGD